ncbi:MAG TPA: DUF2520 domain-containing protein [Candidatus Acidoferrum sp.]|jgi:predicted short-subunit dehydrogenase-like oxidoreductase (DUF2520 family)
MPDTLSIVGAGRVARALGRRLQESGWKIGAVAARSEASARRAVRFIGAGAALSNISRGILATQVILVAVPDDAIAGVAAELARVGAEELRRKVVLHTSGALDSNVLQPLREFGAVVASMHPLQTFSGVRVPPLEGKTFAIEGDRLAVRTARKIVRTLGGAPARIDPRNKLLYHAAGTIAAGHALTVVESATQLLMAVGMKRGEAMRALLPMTRQVLENYEHLGPRAAWTGPLSRGDHGVVAAHSAALGKVSPQFREAYDAMNRLALHVLSLRSAKPIESPEKVLGHAKAKAKTTGGSE